MAKPLKIKQESRDRLFYDRYLYSFNFKLQEVSIFRDGVDHDAIDRVLDYRETWNRSPNFGGSWRSRRGQDITDDVRKNCHAMCDFLLSLSDYKLVTSLDWGYLYTNDLDSIRMIEGFSYVSPLNIKQAILDHPRDTLVVGNSQHEYRSFFRSLRITKEQKEILKSFLNNQEDIRLGPGLIRFLDDKQKYCYINDNNFIDHNSTGTLIMLSLILPKAIRKTVKLLKHK